MFTKVSSFLLAFFLFAASASGNSLPQAFIDALEDAAVAEESEIVYTLVDIDDHNPHLISRDFEGQTFILVASLVDGNYYDAYETDSLYEGSHPALWVTAVPELKNFFVEDISFPEDVYGRIIQLLGLRPEDAPGGKEYSRIVEFWVRPGDLLRPSPDPEVSDREAELEFPALVREYSPDFYLAVDWSTSPPTPVRVDWMEWFNNNGNYDPRSEASFPWTRLGYTYDWGDEENHVGLSEFLMESHAVTYIHSVQSMDSSYFSPPRGSQSGGSGGCSAHSGDSLLVLVLFGGMLLLGLLRRFRKAGFRNGGRNTGV